jgi:hypothetical protein
LSKHNLGIEYMCTRIRSRSPKIGVCATSSLEAQRKLSLLVLCRSVFTKDLTQMRRIVSERLHRSCNKLYTYRGISLYLPELSLQLRSFPANSNSRLELAVNFVLMASSMKAHVVVAALPFISHLTPMRTIAQHLVALGYQVTVITGGALRHSIEDIGATCFVPAAWKDFEESSLAAKAPTFPALIGPVPGVNFMASRFFMNAIPIEFSTPFRKSSLQVRLRILANR